MRNICLLLKALHYNSDDVRCHTARQLQGEKALKRQVRGRVDQRSNVLRECSGCKVRAVLCDSANNIDVTTAELCKPHLTLVGV